MSETDELRAQITLRPFDAGGELRTVALGLDPIILIEAVEVEDDVIFNVDATGLEQEELAVLLESLVDILRNGVEK